MNENSDVTKVLIAHITEDRRGAEELRDQLLLYGANRLECILWEESRQNRLEELKQKIKDTDLLLLLVVSWSVDDGDWGWLQWATAMSWSMSNGNGHVSRILLHNKSLTPPQCIQVAIENSFNSEVNRIKKFLEYFFGSPEFTQDRRSINENLVGNIQELYRISGEISSLFPEPPSSSPPDVYQTTFPEVITLTVDNPRSLIRENLFQNIRVEGDLKSLFLLLSLSDCDWTPQYSWTLQDIVDNLPLDNSQVWIEELADSIFSAHCGRVPKVVQSTYRRADGKLFKPILYRQSKTDNSEKFTVLFVEQISEGWVDNAPTVPLATLLTASILGARLQWALCAKYLPQLDDLQRGGTDAIRRKLREIQFSFDNIEEDARIRGQGEAPGQRNRDRLRDSFDSEDERQTIVNNMSEQEQHKQTLRNTDTQGEVNQNDVNNFRIALTELERLNKIVTAMVARRYSQLLDQNPF
jgi:hypothetical protein